jgi:hypothetical protein
MKLSSAVMIGTMAGSLTIALPVQASHGHKAGSMIIAKRDYGDYRRDRQEGRADERRRSDERQSLRRESGDAKSYGYGYERRQRNADSGESNNADDERRRNRHEERRDERRSNGGWR